MVVILTAVGIRKEKKTLNMTPVYLFSFDSSEGVMVITGVTLQYIAGC